MTLSPIWVAMWYTTMPLTHAELAAAVQYYAQGHAKETIDGSSLGGLDFLNFFGDLFAGFTPAHLN